MSSKKNECVSAKHVNKNTSIWCTTCGDTSVYNAKIRWKIKDESRGIGICCDCATVLDNEYLVLPDKSEDGYAIFS